ncbi:bacterial regulatory s, tetR family protein [Mycobacterium xenopi 3993]|nr:bacterial regulatory s, tetR family protein [Mycobacterium xenopi 3993]
MDDLARAARVTTGALYHHFPTKTALFEAVFEHAHTELMNHAMEAAREASDDLDELARASTRSWRRCCNPSCSAS